MNELTINKGCTSLKFREKMSRLAFTETAFYDSIISNYFNEITNTQFPKKIIHANLIEKLRYGENSHQQSAIYSQKDNLDLIKLHGKN